MSRDEVLLQIRKIVSATLGKDDISLGEHTTANQVEGWDSLTHMEIISSIEKGFNCKFSFMDVVNMECIGDLIDTILTRQECGSS